MSNRNPIRNWAITFPQSGDVERKGFADMFPPRVACICAREEHKDGGVHLHLGIRLKKGITKNNMLTWIRKKFPNDYKRIDVQPTRSISQWADYVSKEDADVYREEEKEKEREEPFEERLRKWIEARIAKIDESFEEYQRALYADREARCKYIRAKWTAENRSSSS